MSVDVVLGVPEVSFYGQLLFIFYTSELFHIVANHILDYADATTIYAVIPKPLSCPQELELLNQDLTEINSWCLKWHMTLRRQNPW